MSTTKLNSNYIHSDDIEEPTPQPNQVHRYNKDKVVLRLVAFGCLCILAAIITASICTNGHVGQVFALDDNSCSSGAKTVFYILAFFGLVPWIIALRMLCSTEEQLIRNSSNPEQNV